MVTIKQVAALAGVSPTTASYALNNRPEVREETRERVIQAAKELNYIPNKLAQSFRNKRSMVINVITNENIERNNTFSSELFGILAAVREKHYNMLITLANDEDCENDLWIANILGNQFCDGYLIFGNSLELLTEKILATGQKGVLLSSHSNLPITQVNSDGYQAIQELAELAISSGRKKLAYFCYGMNTIEEKIRKDAFETVAEVHGAKTAGTYLCGYENENLNEAIEACIETEVDTIICWNDALALSVMSVLRSKEIKIPEQIAITGVDDILGAEQYGLTTAKQDLFQKGYQAVLSLIKEMEQEEPLNETITLPCKVIRRTSL